MPPGPMSSAWHSSTCAVRTTSSPRTSAGVRWPWRRSRGVFRRSMLMPDGTAPSRPTQKNDRSTRGRPDGRQSYVAERLGFLDEEVRDVVGDQVRQLAARALEGALVGAQLERPLALGAGQDVDELPVQRHGCLLQRTPAARGNFLGGGAIRAALPAALRFAELAHETSALRPGCGGRAGGLFAWTLRRFGRMFAGGRPEAAPIAPGDRARLGAGPTSSARRRSSRRPPCPPAAGRAS